LGETGTGKEAVAQLIHHLSPRAGQVFLKVNCAALPAELLESELFGFERGAFTSATQSKPGKFELCDKGTILLDEIAEMAPTLQAKLLHVLQNGAFSRLGARTRTIVDVRVIAATNVDVGQAIAAHRLREDLFYRLSTFVVRVPPLRERHEDIPALLHHYLSAFAAQYGLPDVQVSQDVMDAALSHSWPGNVRELQNFARRYLVLGDTDIVTSRRGDPAAGRDLFAAGFMGIKDLLVTVKERVERDAIHRALEQTNWNRSTAARQLRVSYKSLLNKIRRYGLEHEGRA
jgi:transcriptional regulator with GAF, ATPase, and Fis domain